MEVAHLAVTASPTPLLLIGNDLLADHDGYKFEALTNRRGHPELEFWVPEHRRIVTIPCVDGPGRR